METHTCVSGLLPVQSSVSSIVSEDDAEPPATKARPHPGLAELNEAVADPSRLPRAPSRFPGSPHSHAFRRRFYPEATAAQWNDWRWQVRHRIRDGAGLERIFHLAEEERAALMRQDAFPVGITPYFASLLSRDDPRDPMRRTHIPVVDEALTTPGEADDPLGEDGHTVVPGLVHRYPDRVLFLVSPFCSTYCRYCTRSRMVGHRSHDAFGTQQWERALQYIESHPEVRDVLLSGGDPLTLSDEKLDWLLGRLGRIAHVQMVRIGTKVPVVLPMRITRELVHMLRRHHPLWMSIHFTHPDELTPEVTEACTRLADAGIPLGSQTVLLKGINDDVPTMKALMHGLLRRRVRPYYLYQCDPISGSSHFRTSVSKGLEVIGGLRGHTTGYGVPTYVIDAPGGGGKIPLLPQYVMGREQGRVLLRNFENRMFAYPDEDCVPSV